jgi:carboxynorspermidine decarboxylase
VPLEQLSSLVDERPAALDGLHGLHFHSNCDSETFEPLLKTVRHLDRHLAKLLPRLSWVNLGGGYCLRKAQDRRPLSDAVRLLQSRYGVTVYFEPGAAIVREAGYIISSVIDLFESDEGTIAMLDTTVNHMPEVFEYQFEPDILGHQEKGPHWYTLSGSTCLALDSFGEYGFREPLEVGSRIIFPSAGAYTMVKAHMFNGVNLPSNYVLSADGGLHLRKRYTYQDFLSRCGESATRIPAATPPKTR